MRKYDRIVIWGAGKELKKWIMMLSMVDFIVDKNEKLHGSEICGCEICKPDVLKGVKGKVLILISSEKYEAEIRADISRLQINADVLSGGVYSEINSYAQYGEDIIIDRFFNVLGLSDITYIEIGIPYPTTGSNTYHFYCKGNTGICVEPNPDVIGNIREVRQKDIVVNSGVGSYAEEGTEVKYTRFVNNNAYNTFSQTVAKQRIDEGFTVADVIGVPIISLNGLIKKHLGNKTPDLISIDTEAYEVEILKDFDFGKYDVKIFCIEKNGGIMEIMRKNGYVIAAETPCNFIFMKEGLYNKYFDDSILCSSTVP